MVFPTSAEVMMEAIMYKNAGLTMPAKMSGPYLAGKLLLIINFHIIYTIWGVRSFVMFCYILLRKLRELYRLVQKKRDCFAKHQSGVAGCGWLQPGRNFLST